jgi:hypothetical protein
MISFEVCLSVLCDDDIIARTFAEMDNALNVQCPSVLVCRN